MRNTKEHYKTGLAIGVVFTIIALIISLLDYFEIINIVK